VGFERRRWRVDPKKDVDDADFEGSKRGFSVDLRLRG